MLSPTRTILLASLLIPVTAAAGGGADNVVMVELYTSQGCSSCPPADEHLAVLAERDDVIALALHVDYWDYLGWHDTFAQAEHTRRQSEYRDKMGQRVLFTPQLIVAGAASVPAIRRDAVDKAIAKAAGTPSPVGIDIARHAGMLEALITGQPGRASTIWVASYDKEAVVDIPRGENAGRTIIYRNIVEKLMKVGPYSGNAEAPARFPLPQPAAGEGIAIWLQDDSTGRILAASYAEE